MYEGHWVKGKITAVKKDDRAMKFACTMGLLATTAGRSSDVTAVFVT